ncbi:hypothetical protein [Ruegeria lacuscaerulensis]|uniref:hypothetical protein n=1 Tax=Ruegeria lacuscaerulensis TaxID=55218 RepID=UPI00147E1881|nr:hypothetical protein [Ruegeria lacuscaerulensis]
MNNTNPGNRALNIAASVAIVFGALTVFAGGRALFGSEEARAAVGNAVPFVLWFNFLAGFAYVVAGIGLFLRHRPAVWISIGILVATVLVFLAFGAHVLQGNAYEMRTIGAMTLRTGVWSVISVVAWVHIWRAPRF